MKKNKSPKIILSLLLSLCLGLSTSCSDDDPEIIRNESGSSIEILDNYKVSKFTFENEDAWIIPDSVKLISIGLYSLADSVELTFNTNIVHQKEQHQYNIMIPKNEKIPDGDYLMRGYNKEGISLGRVFQVSFKDEMLSKILSVAVDYKLSGKGTESSPYCIKSQEDYNSFCATLALDENHAFGTYFKQTCHELEVTRSFRNDTLNLEFAGHYNGGNNSVNLNLTGHSDYGSGFFSILHGGASVENITFNCYVMDVSNDVGAVTSKASGDIRLSNVSTYGSIYSKTDNNCGQHIGGLIGYMNDGDLTIFDCHVNGDIQGQDYVGGAIGKYEGGILSIDKFSNIIKKTTGLVKLKGTKHVGYIAGGLYDTQLDLKEVALEHTNAPGVDVNSLKCSEEYLGGFIGEAQLKEQSIIDYSQITADLDGAACLGGLIGALSMKGNATLTINSTFVEQLQLTGERRGNTDPNYVGGFIGKTQLKDQSLLTISDPLTGINSATITGKRCVGGLFGYYEGKLELEDAIDINAKVTATEYGAGGICGEMRKTELTKVEQFKLNSAMTVTSPNSAGGLLGFAQDVKLTGNIQNGLYFPTLKAKSAFPSHFNGIIKSKGGESIGGLVGAAKYCTFKNLCFGGYLEAGTKVGGIAGYAGYVSFENCVNKATEVKATGKSVGGIVGDLTGIVRDDNKFLNITFRNVLNFAKISSTGDYAGGIVGECDAFRIGSSKDSLIFDKMVNLGDVSAIRSAAGCFAYFFDRGRDIPSLEDHSDQMPKIYFQNSANFGKISTTKAGYAAGIVAENHQLTTPYYKGCVNRGTIEVNTKNDDEDTWAGGITAYLGEESPQGTTKQIANGHLEECCNFGTINSTYDDARVGGLVGEKEEGHEDNPDGWWIIKDSYNRGKITGEDVGSIAGYVDRRNTLRNCLDLSNTGNDNEPNDMVGDYKFGDKPTFDHCYILIDSNVRTEAPDRESSASYCSSGEMKNGDHLKGLDFDKTWIIESSKNDGYPHLRNCLFEFSKPE